MRSAPLGQGLGLPSSETLAVPMDGADYLEFAAPGDGYAVTRGVPDVAGEDRSAAAGGLPD